MVSFQSKTSGSTTPRPWLWARLSTMPANRFEISALPCLRLSRIGSLQSPKMASAIPAASMSKH